MVVPPVTQYRRELVGCEANRHRLTPDTWQWSLGEVLISPYWGQAVAIVTIRITFATIGAAAARKFPVLIGKTTSVWHRWWTSLLTLYPTSADLRALRRQRREPIIGLVVDQTALASHQTAVQPPQDDVRAGGTSRKVVLVAATRKLLLILNAVVRDRIPSPTAYPWLARLDFQHRC